MESKEKETSTNINFNEIVNFNDQTSLSNCSRLYCQQIDNEEQTQIKQLSLSKEIQQKCFNLSSQQQYIYKPPNSDGLSIKKNQRLQLYKQNPIFYGPQALQSINFAINSQYYQPKTNQQQLQKQLLKHTKEMPSNFNSNQNILAEISSLNQSSFQGINFSLSQKAEVLEAGKQANNKKSSQWSYINQNSEIIHTQYTRKVSDPFSGDIDQLGEEIVTKQRQASYYQNVNEKNVCNIPYLPTFTGSQIRQQSFSIVRQISSQLLVSELMDLTSEQFHQIQDKLQQINQRKKLQKESRFQQFEHSILIEYPQIISRIIQNSQIIKHQVDAQKLVTFFNKKLSSFQLKFRASDHGFLISRFFELCGNLTNLLLICLTEKDKVVGAFSPPFHKCVNDCQWVEDASGLSFIYSLTNNHKFIIKNKRYAIYRYRTMNNLCFGNGELEICDESNKREDCCSLLNYFYWNPHYTQHEQSWQRFNGNPRTTFKTKQWEIWQVKFENDS